MIRHLLCRQPAIRAGSCACSPANWTRAVVTEISCETVRRTLKNELISWSRIRRCYPPVSEAELVVTMEEVLDLYGQPYDLTEARNAAQAGIDWLFRTEDARICLKKLYPIIEK